MAELKISNQVTPLLATEEPFPLTPEKKEAAKNDPYLKQLLPVYIALEEALTFNCQIEADKLQDTDLAIRKVEIVSVEKGGCVVRRVNGEVRYRCLPAETRKIFMEIILKREMVPSTDERVVEAARKIIALPPHSQGYLGHTYAFEVKIIGEAIEAKAPQLQALVQQFGIHYLFPHPLNPYEIVVGVSPEVKDTVVEELLKLQLTGFAKLQPTPENQLWDTFLIMLRGMKLSNMTRFDFTRFARCLDDKDVANLKWMIKTTEGQTALRHILESDPVNADTLRAIGSISLQELDAITIDANFKKTFILCLKFIVDNSEVIKSLQLDEEGLAFVLEGDGHMDWLKTPAGRETLTQVIAWFPESVRETLKALRSALSIDEVAVLQTDPVEDPN